MQHLYTHNVKGLVQGGCALEQTVELDGRSIRIIIHDLVLEYSTAVPLMKMNRRSPVLSLFKLE